MSWNFPKSMCKFLRRNRNRFIFTGVFVGGVYGVIKFAEYKINQFMREENEKSIKERQDKTTLSQVQVHSISITDSMLESLMEKIMQTVNTECITSQIKTGKGNKLEMWNDLKVAVLQRTITAIYVVVAVVLVIRIQLTQIAGAMSTNQGSLVDDSKQRFLSLSHNYLINEGISTLAKQIYLSTHAVIKGMPLQCLLDGESLKTTLKSITSLLASKSYGFKLSAHVFPNLVEGTSSFSNEIIKELEVDLVATIDILESPDCAMILEHCVCSGIELLVDDISDLLASSVEQDFDELKQPSLPLAKLLPLLNSKLSFICSSHFTRHISSIPPLSNFTFNIFQSYKLK